ncbi:DNA-binding LacI/PurR family transcriptional regulator [Kribbella antiqua]|uniref:DNA-binding LacI/PurR family transcriptional regulator n=1 Tax=Kribbella antiqua TaxID=2512217 RepID=A0A4R2I522_9ACTN|nr:LacI family DNA-binding transcriptional regulator [Kribbella antiqua]TCO39047.1 DNA-binding LacI/PurR family transcriptional regulator [Kribbella antiqua]
MTDISRRQVTLDEVAERAGVSRSAASRVINNAPHVSKAKREAVQRAVVDLGYVPNATARALATQQAGAVVLAISSDNPQVFADPFFAEVVVGVNSVLEETELELMLLLATSTRGQTRLEQLLRTRQADGVMMMSTHGDTLAELADKADVPVVFGGRPVNFEPRFYVDADNRGGARLATEHLVDKGRTRIATITGRMDEGAGTARFKGYQEALAVAGLDAGRVAHGDFSEDGGSRAMAELLSEHPDLDAVFIASDQMAIGALRVLTDAGRSVPGDVAIVGFNDIPSARHTAPPLTTVNQPIQALGREMARMLQSLMSGETPSPLILPTRLIQRAST